LGALATRIEAVLAPIDTQGKAKDTTIGVLSARPAFGTAGRRYYATDVVADYIDTGTAWLRTSTASGLVASILAAAAPTGWRLCDGTTIANTGATLELYAAIGATLPDLRGRTVIGAAAANIPAANDPVRTLTVKGGVTGVILSAAQSGIPAHSHNIDGGRGVPAVGAWALANVTHGAGAFNNDFPARQTLGAGFTSPSTVDNNGAAGASSSHENMPPFQVLNWVVKL
jgi:microcystin-dependent protein